MDSKLTIDFLNKIKTLEDKEYLLSTIMFHGAPVLDRKKPSCLISFSSGKRDMYQIWNTYRLEIPKLINLNYSELYRDSQRELVLFYNLKSLEETMGRPENISFLRAMGYGNTNGLSDTLEMLKGRFSSGLPHEIGIMLGIPGGDVEGFIKNSGMNYILNGYWKVYSRPERAVKLFKEYDYSRINVMKGIMRILQ